MSTVAAPLFELLRKESEWNFDAQNLQAFEEIKRLIYSAPVLVHYDPKLPLVLSADASPYGVGGVLAHIVDGVERPVAFTSRSLSPSENGYSQIDREALAIVYSVVKFQRYLFGRNFTLFTDHAPLTHIFGNNKNLTELGAARLQRCAILLKSFSFQIRYRKGPLNGNADALSRAPVDHSQKRWMKLRFSWWRI